MTSKPGAGDVTLTPTQIATLADLDSRSARVAGGRVAQPSKGNGEPTRTFEVLTALGLIARVGFDRYHLTYAGVAWLDRAGVH